MNYFSCSFEWLWNLYSNIKGRRETEGVCVQDAEENIWTEEEGNNRTLEKTT
jgi:hypothetical protein